MQLSFTKKKNIRKNFGKLKGNIFNLGLSSANISKIMLARKIQKQYKKLRIKIVTNRKDPDKRDYFVSNKKIEKKGFKAKISLEDGISELIKIFTNDKNKVINIQTQPFSLRSLDFSRCQSRFFLSCRLST